MVKKGFLIITLAILAFSCRKKTPAAMETVNADTLPTSEFFGPTELSCTEGKDTKWRLHTTHIIRYDQKKKINMDPVTVYIYTENRRDSNILTANSGEIADDLSSLAAWGNVVVNTYDGKRLLTEEIHWDKNTDKISSPKFVKLTTREGDVITGTGFEADNSLNRWKIMNRVKAKIKQVEKKSDNLP
jgi:LPS export ABC transporter protein LptC